MGGRTVRITLGSDILFAAGDVLELEISELVGPFVISAIGEMSEADWPTVNDDEDGYR